MQDLKREVVDLRTDSCWCRHLLENVITWNQCQAAADCLFGLGGRRRSTIPTARLWELSTPSCLPRGSHFCILWFSIPTGIAWGLLGWLFGFLWGLSRSCFVHRSVFEVSQQGQEHQSVWRERVHTRQMFLPWRLRFFACWPWDVIFKVMQGRGDCCNHCPDMCTPCVKKRRMICWRRSHATGHTQRHCSTILPVGKTSLTFRSSLRLKIVIMVEEGSGAWRKPAIETDRLRKKKEARLCVELANMKTCQSRAADVEIHRPTFSAKVKLRFLTPLCWKLPQSSQTHLQRNHGLFWTPQTHAHSGTSTCECRRPAARNGRPRAEAGQNVWTGRAKRGPFQRDSFGLLEGDLGFI